MEGVKTAIERVRTKAAIPQLSTYSFRQKAATVLRRARVSEDQIAVQLGHHRPGLGSLWMRFYTKGNAQRHFCEFRQLIS
jgi:integrase